MRQYKSRQDCNCTIFYNFYNLEKKNFNARRTQVVYK